MDLRLPAAVLIIVILALSFASISLLNENSSLKGQLAQRNAELTSANSLLNSSHAENSRLNYQLEGVKYELARTNKSYYETLGALNQTQAELTSTQMRLYETENELNESRSELADTYSQLEDLLGEVYTLEDSINSSIQWFKDNSVLPYSTHLFMIKVDNYCVKDGKVNLACINYLMENDLGFEYISESPDRLYSLDEMLNKKKGGDCEDYALLLKAILSQIKEENSSLDVEAWSPMQDEEYIIYEKGDKYWYLEAYGLEIGDISETTPYVICYTTGMDENGLTGHCIVALSNEEITSAANVDNLNGAKAFEPQSGEFMGNVGKNRAFEVCEKGDAECETNVGSIHFIIANDDLYEFTGGQWKSYHLYYNSTQIMEKSLREELSGFS